jgi:CheY-like chemotaxis protein
MSDRPGAPAENECGCVVLLTDDHDLLRRVRARSLEWLGLKVFTAPDADAALSCLETTRVHVLVADLLLPRMDGVALLQEAKRRQPTLGRVLISGAITVEAREWAEREDVPVVLKGEDPPDVLARVVLRECARHGSR